MNNFKKIKSALISVAVGICLICVPFLQAYSQTAEQNYAMYCSACHGAKLEESKVNSLVKKDWKHGNDKPAIIKTISEGIPNTQMISWKAVLSEKEIEALANYILSFQPKEKPSKRQ